MWYVVPAARFRLIVARPPDTVAVASWVRPPRLLPSYRVRHVATACGLNGPTRVMASWLAVAGVIAYHWVLGALAQAAGLGSPDSRVAARSRGWMLPPGPSRRAPANVSFEGWPKR